MSGPKKLLYDFLLVNNMILATAFLWDNDTVLFALILLISILMLFFIETSRPMAMLYFAGVLLGSTFEMLIIHFGAQQGAWQFATPHFLGIPYWLPCMWGNISLLIGRMAYVLQKSFGNKEV